VAAKRSPILGYNHNVRFRGVVFHVQTEDSGITNPHVFTHLFHGGVIVNTRKLVYDAEAAEETVKALMQSQHKAVLRELKGGVFDDKIDAYLIDAPGLLPRGVDDGGAVAPEPTRPVPLVPPIELEETPPATDLATLSRAPTESPSAELLETLIPAGTPTTAAGLAPIAPRTPTPPGPVIPRAITAPVVPPSGPTLAAGLPPPAPQAPPPTRLTQPRAAMMAPGVRPLASPPPVLESIFPAPEPGEERREVSQAFRAMQVDDDVAQVHSPAQPSVALPPGAAPERPGEYAQHRKRESGPMSPIPATAPPPAPLPAARPPEAARPPHPATVPPPPPRPPATPPPLAPRPLEAARPPMVPPPQPRPMTPPPLAPPTPARGMVPPVARPATPPVARANTPSTSVPRLLTPTRPATMPPRTRPPSGGGVVMSKPAVIVGAPSKVVGGAAPPGTPPLSPRTTTGRVRKAREDTESGMFGQDLISEKSLDEVILAYLSEDLTEDG
jgi:hypothetical protein